MQKIIAVFFISVGLAAVSAPLFYHFYGNYKTKKLISRFEQCVSQEQKEDGEKQKKRENFGYSEDEALLSSVNVIGLIEIEALHLRYPIVEGTDSKQLSHGIGHILDTGAIGRKGNCVLAGHRGSRYGTYFKYLNRLSKGDTVKVTDKEGHAHYYEVDSWEVVDPYDNSIKAQREERELTLLTCEKKGTMRLIYHCSYKEGD